jgi:putative transposase
MITAACYLHRPIIAESPARIAEFEEELLQALSQMCPRIYAWSVLPNHYHVLAMLPGLKSALKALQLLHGRTSYRWNGEESCRGRTVWHRAAETAMRSDRHFWASLNYVLNNAVRHGYVNRWQDWPYSSAAHYLSQVGREEAERRWREYPVLDYGDHWDPPEL